MSDDPRGWMILIPAITRAVLHDRHLRRRMLAQSLMVALGQMVLGLWVIDGWLRESLWRFLIWWAGCAAVTLWVIIFALYDALAVIREERQKMLESKSRENSPCDD